MNYMGDATWWNGRFQRRADSLLPPEEKLKSDLPYFAECKRILDLACGDGRNAIYLAKLGFEVFAADFSTEALDRLRRFAALEHLEIETRWIDLTSEEAGSELEIQVDAIVVNHYRVSRELYPILSSRLRDDGILWLNGFAAVPEDNPNVREEDLLQDEDFVFLQDCVLLSREPYEAGGRSFVRYIWKKEKR